VIRETIIVHLLPVLIGQETAQKCFELLRQGYSLEQVLQNYPQLKVYLKKNLEELRLISEELLSQEEQDLLEEALIITSRTILEKQYKQ